MSRRLDALAARPLGAVLLGIALLGTLFSTIVPPRAAPAEPAQKPPAAKPTSKPAAPPSAASPALAAKSEPAPSPTHIALAREVMFNSGIARSFDSILPTFADQIRKNAASRPELAKELDEVLTGLKPEMELQKQRMIDVAGRIYARRLTEAELQDIVVFFRSPAGKRYVETQPQVLDELVGAMQDWTQEVSEYILIRVRAEMGKRGHKLQ